MDGDFLKVRAMNFPRSIILGHGVLSQTADVCKSLMFGNEGLIITGGQTYDAAGKGLEDQLTDNGYCMEHVSVGNPDQTNVNKAVEAARKCNAKFLLAVGGGSKIDTTKMVAKETGLPFISIPTSVAHDGICSDRASIKTPEGKPLTVPAVPPTAILGDTEVIVKAPFRFLASGCADVISNVTALYDWELARDEVNAEFSTSAFALSKYAAQGIIDNAASIKPESEEGVWAVLKPVVASGTSMCIAGSSRPTSGSEHMFSHALDLLTPNKKSLHGEQCGIGCIIMMCLQGGKWKKIQKVLKTIGAPTTASELGVADEDIIDALVAAQGVRKDRYTILRNKPLSREDAINLATITGVI